MKTDELAVSGTSGIIGVGGSIAAVSTYGTVSGLSAAGISSGLAAIGGSMLGGLVVIGAIPLLSAGIGYGIYSCCKPKRKQFILKNK